MPRKTGFAPGTSRGPTNMGPGKASPGPAFQSIWPAAISRISRPSSVFEFLFLRPLEQRHREIRGVVLAGRPRQEVGARALVRRHGFAIEVPGRMAEHRQ